jgi:RNA polymerase sigma factor (sigma-70 family)
VEGVELISMADEVGHGELLGPAVPLPLAELEGDFDAFYRRELPAMVTLATAIAGAERGEELAQEAMLRAHRDWAQVSRYDKPGAWLRRVTTNLAISARRRRVRERLALRRLDAEPTVEAPPPEVDEFWTLVRTLPPRQGAAIALYYLHDLSVADLAESLGCSEGTAKAHLYKARTTLATRIGVIADRGEGAEP